MVSFSLPQWKVFMNVAMKLLGGVVFGEKG